MQLLVKLRGFPACGAPCESGPQLPPAEETGRGRQTDMPFNSTLLIHNLRRFILRAKGAMQMQAGTECGIPFASMQEGLCLSVCGVNSVVTPSRKA